MPQIVAAAVAAAIPATSAIAFGTGATAVTWASIIGSVATTAASVALEYALQPKIPRSVTKTLKREADANRFAVYGGTVQVEGAAVFYHAIPEGDILWVIQAMGDGPIDGYDFFKLNDKEMTVNGPAGYVATAPYNSGRWAGARTRARIYSALGTDDQISFVDIVGADLKGPIASTWTSAHRLLGISYAVACYLRADVIKRQAYQFPQGIPNLKAGIRGRRVWNWRDTGQLVDVPSTWLVTNNPVVNLLDYLTKPVSKGGLQIPLAKFDLDVWTEAANDCDDPIPLKSGGTIPRYEMRGIQDYTVHGADTIAMFGSTCDGQIFRTSAGLIGYRIGKDRTPPDYLTFSTADNTILSYSDIKQGASRLASFNVAKLKFTSPDHNYQLIPCQDWREDAWITKDGKDRPQPLELPEVYKFAQARRLAKIFIRKGNPERVGTIRTSLKGLRAFYDPVIRIKIEELGLDFNAEVLGIQPVEGQLTPAVDIEFRSLAADTYTWDPNTEEGEPPPPIPESGDDAIVEPPTDPEFTVGIGPRIVAAADQRDFDPGVLQVRWRLSGTTDWTGENAGIENHAETDSGLTVGVDYDVSLKWLVTVDGHTRESAWTDFVTVNATVNTDPITAATDLAAEVVSGDVFLSWNNSAASCSVKNSIWRASVASPGAAVMLDEQWGSRGEAMQYNDTGLTVGVYLYFIRSTAVDGAFIDTDPITVDLTNSTNNIVGIGAGNLLGAGGGNFLGWGPV